MRATTFALAVTVAAPAVLATPADAQSFEGTYQGSYVCERTAATRGVLRVPIDLVVNGANVRFGRPLFNMAGTRVTGTELASGTIDGTGNVHLASGYDVMGFAVRGAYEGTLGPHGGTLTGTQSWRWPDGNNGSRTCVAALVPTQSAPRSAGPQARPSATDEQPAAPEH
jgi:hypothetical protein